MCKQKHFLQYIFRLLSCRFSGVESTFFSRKDRLRQCKDNFNLTNCSFVKTLAKPLSRKEKDNMVAFADCVFFLKYIFAPLRENKYSAV
jgi:hypothetical protein